MTDLVDGQKSSRLEKYIHTSPVYGTLLPKGELNFSNTGVTDQQFLAIIMQQRTPVTGINVIGTDVTIEAIREVANRCLLLTAVSFGNAVEPTHFDCYTHGRLQDALENMQEKGLGRRRVDEGALKKGR